MVQAYGTTALNEPSNAVRAQEVITAAADPPNSNLYAQLAALAYQAKDNRTGDLAGDKAVRLAPAASRKALRTQLNALKTASLQQQTPGATTTPTG